LTALPCGGGGGGGGSYPLGLLSCGGGGGSGLVGRELPSGGITLSRGRITIRRGLQ